MKLNLKAKNWGNFQHYKTPPPWIKLHRHLLDDFEWHCLPDASKALAPMLWLLASEQTDGIIRLSTQEIAFRLRTTVEACRTALEPLVSAGFFSFDEDASALLAERERLACSESERESESETEREGRASARRSAGKDMTLLPDGWCPSVEDEEWTRKHRSDLAQSAVADQLERFRQHTKAKSWRASDWGAAWRKWLMDAREAPAGGRAKVHEAQQDAATAAGPLPGRDGRWRMWLPSHRKPGDPWDPANGPAPESSLDNPSIPDEARREWRRRHGLPIDWRGAGATST